MLQSFPMAEGVAEQPLAQAQTPIFHGRVLFAEDVSAVSAVVRRVLQNMNLEVEIAEDGQAACEMAHKSLVEGRPYDLIFMDIQMPRLNGYDATRWLRQHGWKGPIVALTAHALVGDREKCVAAGCEDYIAKPFTTTGLQSILALFGPTNNPSRSGRCRTGGRCPARCPVGRRLPGCSESRQTGWAFC